MSVSQALLDILSESDLPHDVVSVAVHLAASLVLVSPAILDCQPLLVRVVEGVCGRVEEVELVLEFFHEVAGYPQFQEVSWLGLIGGMKMSVGVMEIVTQFPYLVYRRFFQCVYDIVNLRCKEKRKKPPF